jgi:hypothetical protein
LEVRRLIAKTHLIAVTPDDSTFNPVIGIKLVLRAQPAAANGLYRVARPNFQARIKRREENRQPTIGRLEDIDYFVRRSVEGQPDQKTIESGVFSNCQINFVTLLIWHDLIEVQILEDRLARDHVILRKVLDAETKIEVVAELFEDFLGVVAGVD